MQVRVLAQLAWEQPAVFGFDDDQMRAGVDLQVRPPEIIPFFQAQLP
jgi:hypothetical protein